jgi:hypothetical protein
MNGSVSRRVFVGSVAAAGVGAAGATSLLEFDVAAQPAARDPLIREIRHQLKQAIGQMRQGQSGGARQLSATLRIYASTVNDNQLRAALRKANRQQLLLTDMHRTELVRQAEELGINPSTLPPHSLNRLRNEEAFDRLRREGLAPSMREAADYVDNLAAKLENLAQRRGGPQALAIALRQPIPEPVDCGNCGAEQSALASAEAQMAVACALAAIFPIPPVEAACAAAAAAFLVLFAAYGACEAIVAFCRYYYGQ